MILQNFSDLARSSILKNAMKELQAQSVQITNEINEGVVTDVAKHLDGDQSTLSNIKRARVLNTAYSFAVKEAKTYTDNIQNSLNYIREAGEKITEDLAISSTGKTGFNIKLAAERGRSTLEATIATLNTHVAGKALFAGMNVTNSPVVESNTMLQDVLNYAGNAATAEDVMERVVEWFTIPQGYTQNSYVGGEPRRDIPVSNEKSAWVGITANDESIRGVLAGFAAAALLDDNALNLNNSERVKLARLTTDTTRNSTTQITALSAKLALSEEIISYATAANESEKSELEIAQDRLIGSNPYELSIEMQSIRTNLEILYELTAQLSKMKLSDYLR